MSKKWYPVINYENCIECGACVEKCQNGVYEKDTNSPNVIFTDGCIEGCRGCQALCAAAAIEYAGDINQDNSCGSGCTCDCKGSC